MWMFGVTVVRPKRVQKNHESRALPDHDATARANSFHAAVHHRRRLRARVHPFLTTRTHTHTHTHTHHLRQSTSNSPLRKNKKRSPCESRWAVERCWCTRNMAGRPSSAVCLLLLCRLLRLDEGLEEMCAATQTSTRVIFGSWHPQRQMWYEMMGGSRGGGWGGIISETVMWATWGNAASPRVCFGKRWRRWL